MKACNVSKDVLWAFVEEPRGNGTDAQLRSHVEGCPACREKMADFRRLQARFESLGRMAAPALPERIGPHRVVRLIGEGGMGTVYEAEQSEPARRVAIKVLRPGTSNGHRVRAFPREVQTLGRLRHDSIARIHDAGRNDAGEPNFVMELVEGQRLDRYCTEQGMTLRERLALFATVCRTVHYAHQRGVIHRDLKPANILVAKDGRPTSSTSGSPVSSTRNRT